MHGKPAEEWEGEMHLRNDKNSQSRARDVDRESQLGTGHPGPEYLRGLHVARAEGTCAESRELGPHGNCRACNLQDGIETTLNLEGFWL